MLWSQTRKGMIERRDEEYIDPRAFHELDFLLECTNQSRCAIRRQELNRMRCESHRDGLHAKLPRAFYDSFQDFEMPEVQAIKVSDAYDRRMRDIRIGQ